MVLSSGDNIRIKPDRCLDTLLLLDGEVFVAEGNFRVKFQVKEVTATPEKPHGLDYSLTLHDGGGERLLRFDNAHPIREGSGRAPAPGSNMTINIKVNESGSTTTKMQ